MFGLMRPYKGIDVLLEAWRGAAGVAGEVGHVGSGAKGVGSAIEGAGSAIEEVGSVIEKAGSAIENAELWIAGMPRMDISPLRASAPPNVYFVPRFITDDELPAYFERADLVVLPYLQADQSGVLFTALAFGKPLLLSDVGGFPEIADTGAARIVPAGDARALGQALRELLGDRVALTEMGMRAKAAAHGRYSWEAVAHAHVELYRSL